MYLVILGFKFIILLFLMSVMTKTLFLELLLELRIFGYIFSKS